MLVPVLNDYKILYFNINNLYWVRLYLVKKYFKFIEVDFLKKNLYEIRISNIFYLFTYNIT